MLILQRIISFQTLQYNNKYHEKLLFYFYHHTV